MARVQCFKDGVDENGTRYRLYDEDRETPGALRRAGEGKARPLTGSC